MRIGATVVVIAVLGALPPLAAAESTMEKRLRVLEEQLRRAQEEIRQLHRELEQQKAIGQATQKQTEQVVQTQREQVKAVETAKKGLDIPDWMKRTTLFGDVRLRHEAFYHQPHKNGDLIGARNLERFRARVGVKVTFSDELSASVRAATGEPDNPVSTNETLTGSFSRKHVNLDWAYLTFTPGTTFGIRPGLMSITGGKFPNPIFRVGQLVFDDDLSPEGASETLSLLAQPCGALDQLKLHLLQWTFNEIANKEDGWMFGGQINSQAHVGPMQLEAGLGQYWWLNSDQIALALSTNKLLINTNELETSGGKTIGYKSAFNQSNATLAATYPKLIGALPLKAYADYVYNWEAANDDAHGIMAGLLLGQTKARADWAVGGYWEHLGQEAVISAFTYNDFGRGGSNVEGWVAQLSYQLLNPLTLTARSHFTNFIKRPTGTTNPTLTRLQLDAEVKF